MSTETEAQGHGSGRPRAHAGHAPKLPDWLRVCGRFDTGLLLGFVNRCGLSAWRPHSVGGFSRLLRWGFTWCSFCTSRGAAGPEPTIFSRLPLAFFVVGLLVFGSMIIMAQFEPQHDAHGSD